MTALDTIKRHFAPDPPATLGVAVSGGGDSMALLHLLHAWCRSGGPQLRAATVDHGLRRDAADEAAGVSQLCADLGIPHETLDWQGWDGSGNLPDHARRARYALLAEWASGHGTGDVTLGHTEDDLAETFIMRLARGAGVDGLSAMRDRWRHGPVTFHRPLLEVSRVALRDVLRAQGVGWVEDPTNRDMTYERARVRDGLGALAAAGLDTPMLAQTARRLAEARTALDTVARAAADDIVRFEAGDILLARARLAALPDEVARRVLQACLRWIAGADYPPRGAAMTQFLGAARAGEAMTLQGCLLHAGATTTRIGREYAAVRDLRASAGEVWDGRWRIEGPAPVGAEIAALGPDGLKCCPDWRESGLPHASALASPALWHAGRLVAAPLVGWNNGHAISLVRDERFFFDTSQLR
ncbi:tRNA lysidine(34) synthetase TilS [Roseovarius sp. D22-M7]|uniref:tRNA lysidine(34) synthetase TilS n=1 Tax=Roseovarius sp. D22-M7 TaxID=3127116 RepID=UPI00300FB290